MNDMPTPEKAFEMYQMLVEGNEQAIPVLVFGAAEAIVPCGIAEVPAGGIQPVLHRIIPRLKSQFGPASWVVLSCESWYRSYPKDARDEVMNLPPGELGRQKEAGSVEVKECVSITGISADGQNWTYVRGFERLESGQVIWDEPHLQAGDQNIGGIPDILLAAVR